MLVEYKRDLSHNYMLIHAEEELPKDSYELRVLMANRIPGILPLEFEDVNGCTAFRYDITSCQPFNALCSSGRMSADILRELYFNLLENLLSFEDYLLNSSHLMLEMDSLFLKWEERTLMVPYVPDYEQNLRRSLISLTESIIMQISHGQEGCIVLACQILHELQKKELHLSELRIFLENSSETEKAEAGAALPDRDRNEAYTNSSPPSEREAEEIPLYSFDDLGLEKDSLPPASSSLPGSAALTGAIRTQIPERETIRMELIAAIPAALLYVLLQVQSVYLLSFTETAGAALLAAAILLLVQRLVQKHRQDHGRQKTSARLDRELQKTSIRQGRRPQKTSIRQDQGSKKASVRLQKRRQPKALSKASEREFENEVYPDDPFSEEDMVPLYALSQEIPSESCEDTAEEGQTTILSGSVNAEARNCPALIPVDPSLGLPPIPVQGREILIGKQKNLVDAVIDKGTISRIHARIFRKNNLYYLSDMGSRNGTAIDGRAVVGRDEVPLADGAQVTFSDITYVYKA